MSKLDHHHAAGLFVLFLLFTITRAQQPSSTDDNNTNNNYLSATSFNPSVAILIIVLISVFFFLGFFSIYIRNCGAASSNGGNGASIRGLANAMTRSRRQRGLEPAVLETFPTMVYSEVKEHKIGKGSLECAICLSEFEDDENLRLLPKCDHVFHTDCIDAWLASHVTCPVCRCNLTPDPNQPSSETQVQEGDSSGVADHQVAIDVQADGTTDQERNIIDQETIELERIGSQRRAIRAKSVKRPTNFTRSHSTGHSIIIAPPAVQAGESVAKDKYTLKLPENIRKEIIASGQFKRSKSLQFSFPSRGEASSRRGFRFGGGEGSSRGGRSIRLGQSGKWPSFVLRNFSTRVPARSGNKIKPDAEESNSSQV